MTLDKQIQAASVKKAELLLRLATELQLWEQENGALPPVLLTMTIASFLAGVAVMDGIPKSVALRLLENSDEWGR